MHPKSSINSTELARIAASVRIAYGGLRTMLLRMQSAEQSREIEVDARQATAFANPARVRVLMACAVDERSLAGLQRQLDLPLATLHYHVSRLLTAQLLIVNRTQARAGRAIKFYRAVGGSFLVPPDGLVAPPGDALAEQLRQSLHDERSRCGELSLRYTFAPDGKVLAKLVPQEPRVASRALELWRIVKLDARQRSSLAKELGDVLERYASAPQQPGADAMLVHAAFGPRSSRN